MDHQHVGRPREVARVRVGGRQRDQLGKPGLLRGQHHSTVRMGAMVNAGQWRGLMVGTGRGCSGSGFLASVATDGGGRRQSKSE